MVVPTIRTEADTSGWDVDPSVKRPDTVPFCVQAEETNIKAAAHKDWNLVDVTFIKPPKIDCEIRRRELQETSTSRHQLSFNACSGTMSKRCNSNEESSKTQVAHHEEIVNSLTRRRIVGTNEPILVMNDSSIFVFNAGVLITCDQKKEPDPNA